MAPSPAEHHSFFATSPRNTEGLLQRELASLGAQDASETRGGVAFTGPLSLAYRACLWSRVASRVLLRLQTFEVSSPDDLYEATRAVPWEDHLATTGTLAVETTSSARQGPLARVNTHFVEQRVKDAVVDRFRARTGARPGVALARPDLRVSVHLADAETVVGLDLSGDGLHRRGYRAQGGEAPLRENLAAAILLRAGWPRVAAAGGALLDPLCGSGTLLIEGAFMAADIAPGLLRNYFGFLGWKGFEPATWTSLLDEAAERRERGLQALPPIVGFDLDKRAAGTARANARRAGLAGRMAFEQRPLAELQYSDRLLGPRPGNLRDIPGLVVANPPYGKRLGGPGDLVELYETLGEKLKQDFDAWDAAVFTGNPELGAYLGLRAHRVNVLYNGPLECRLLLFHIGQVGKRKVAGRPHDATPVKPGQTGSGFPLPDARVAGAFMFENRLRKNHRHLRRWATREGVECYRLYDADLPEYSVAVDLYGDWAHVQEYAPPNTVDPVRARRRLKDVMAVVPEVLDLPPGHVVLKIRRRQRGSDQYQRFSDQDHLLEVGEGGLRFLVNLTDYLDTGLFLDHRLTRSLIRDLSSGRRFLNLFAYTGSASVYSAAGGAATTTTVDLSPTYLAWARRNMELNGFSGSDHSYVRTDCLRWLERTATRSAARYDLIFLDAPTFSNSKSMTGSLDIQRDHGRVVRAAMRLLAPAGILLFSTNFRRFKLDPGLSTEFTVDDITTQTIPPDFVRNPRVHRCYRITPAAVSVGRTRRDLASESPGERR